MVKAGDYMCQYCLLLEFHTATVLVLLTAAHEKIVKWGSFSGTVFMKICQMIPKLLKVDARHTDQMISKACICLNNKESCFILK
jgi:hypothetical protein